MAPQNLHLGKKRRQENKEENKKRKWSKNIIITVTAKTKNEEKPWEALFLLEFF